MGTLYSGDDLDVLARGIADESVDLDLPFKSALNSNLSSAQKTSFV